jgi:hypothetical protein
MAVLAVAAMVVAMTPRTSSGPVALSATTTPITARAVVDPPTSAEPAVTAPTTSSAVAPIDTRIELLTSFAAFPHAVTSGPQLDVDGTDIATAAPHDNEMVYVRTEAVTYRLRWGVAQMMNVPDGSVVFDADGELVARVDDGDLLSLVAD